MIKKFIVLFLGIITVGFASDIKIGGLLESYHSYKINEEGEVIGNRNRARLNFRKENNNIYTQISLRAINNEIVSDKSNRIELYEAYCQYYQTNWDLTFGRQIYNWGKADGIRIMDAISPVDYREFLTRDFDETRLPLESFKFRYMPGTSEFEFVWIPKFKPARIPDSPDNPWYRSQMKDKIDLETTSPQEPELTLENSEIAVKYSAFTGGIDLSASASYLWEDRPVLSLQNGKAVSEFHRIIMGGASLSKPIGDLVVRAEGNIIEGQYFHTNTEKLSVEKGSARYLVGIDWYPGNNFTLSTQLANQQFIFDYTDQIIPDQNNYLATINFRKEFFRQKLELENMIYYGFDEQDIFERLSVDYAMTDNFHLACGIDYFWGKNGYLGAYDNNDSFWLKAKYNF